MALTFIDSTGKQCEVNLQEVNPMYHFQVADKKGVSFRQHINSTFQTRPGDPDAFTQFCLNAGIRFKKNQRTGEPSANLRELLDPNYANQTGGTSTTSPLVPDSRLLFAPAVMEAVNAAIETYEADAMGAFAELIGRTDSIYGDRWEQPVVSTDGKGGPEDSARRRSVQNSPPPVMLSITAADYTRTIPTKTIGMEISDKVLGETTLDFIAEALVKFELKADYSEWITWLGLILSGDSDGVNTPMATVKSALDSITAASLDSTGVTANGQLSQAAWVQYFMRDALNGSNKKTHIVTTIACANAIDTRTNRPTRTVGDVSDRIDVPFQIVYPNLQPVKVLAMPSGTWTANTLMGLNSRWAIQKVISTQATYEAMQDVVMNRSRQYRWDRGYLLQRYYDDAFDVMTLTGF